MYYYSLSLFILLFFTNCTLSTTENQSVEVKSSNAPKIETKVSCEITDNKLLASYKGPEFLNGRDTAHLLSNLVADKLGQYLKSEFKKGNFLKIDFENTKIETKGNPQFSYPSEEIVHYTIEMPLLKVKTKCAGFTGVEHRGTWARNDIESGFSEWIQKLKAQIAVGNIDSKLFKTPEGFKEYWIQFKHKSYQGDCN
jgi:hypothetical protein